VISSLVGGGELQEGSSWSVSPHSALLFLAVELFCLRVQGLFVIALSGLVVMNTSAICGEVRVLRSLGDLTMRRIAWAALTGSFWTIVRRFVGPRYESDPAQ
jgi:hypothetical protein